MHTLIWLLDLPVPILRICMFSQWRVVTAERSALLNHTRVNYTIPHSLISIYTLLLYCHISVCVCERSLVLGYCSERLSNHWTYHPTPMLPSQQARSIPDCTQMCCHLSCFPSPFFPFSSICVLFSVWILLFNHLDSVFYSLGFTDKIKWLS